MPKLASGSGSMTQWITSCRCDVFEAPRDVQLSTLNLCKTCGKRVNSGRTGSFTQFIFRFDLCACDKPDFVARSMDLPASAAIGEALDEFAGIEIDQEIDLAKEFFPLERYQPLQTIGKGAAGQVYLCRDLALNKRVAVKTLQARTSDQLLAFQNEARVLSKLDHPNILRILDFGATAGGAPYMVLDYSPAISLKDEITRRGSLPPEMAIKIFVQLAEALQYCHDRQVMHRDLKPDNILYMEDKNGNPLVQLIDFGIALLKDQETTQMNGRAIAGTPAYMAPDQVRGYKYDARSEIYSFGCVLFEALCGRPPFIAETSLEVLNKHASEALPDISQLTENELPEPLTSCLHTCLSKQPSKRFQTMAEVLSALASAREEARAVPVHKAVDTEPLLEPDKKASALLVVAIVCSTAVLLVVAFYMLKPTEFPTAAKKERSVQEPDDAINPLDRDVDFNPQAQSFRVEQRKLAKAKYNLFGNISRDSFKKILDTYHPQAIFFQPDNLKFDLDDLDLVNTCPTLNEIGFGDTKFSDEDCKRLLNLPAVNAVNLGATQITDEGVKTLSRKKNLIELSIAHTRASGKSLQYLKQLPRLRILRIEFCSGFSANDMKTIKDFPALEHLTADSVHFADSGLKELSKARLRALNANDTSITDKGVSSLAGSSVEKLAIGDNPGVTDKSVSTLLTLPRLSVLFIGMRTRITDEGEKALLRAKPHLKIKQATGWVSQREYSALTDGINDMQVLDPLYFAKEEHEAQAAELRFSLKRTSDTQAKVSGKLDREDLETLSKLTWLKRLSLSPGTKVEWRALGLLNNSNVDALDLQFVRPGDAEIEYISRLVKIRDLDLSNSRCTIDGVTKIAQMKNLARLRLCNTKFNAAEVLPVLKAMPALRALELQNITSVTASDIELLNEFPELEVINISSNPLDLICIKALANLKVPGVDISDCSLQNDDLRIICRNDHLRRLCIAHNRQLNADCLKHFASMSKLRLLKMESVPVTREAQVELMNKVPGLRVTNDRGLDATE